MILAGDIGGTKTNLVIFTIEGDQPSPVVKSTLTAPR